MFQVALDKLVAVDAIVKLTMDTIVKVAIEKNCLSPWIQLLIVPGDLGRI